MCTNCTLPHNLFFEFLHFQKEVISFIDARERQKYNIRCDYNLLNLKHERSTREFYDAYQERYASARNKSLFVSSCYKALYAHDWDRLLYILKRVPRWRFQSMHTFHMRVSKKITLGHSYQIVDVHCRVRPL